LYCFIFGGGGYDYDDDDGHDNLTVVTTTKGTKMKRWKDNLEIFPRKPLLASALQVRSQITGFGYDDYSNFPLTIQSSSDVSLHHPGEICLRFFDSHLFLLLKILNYQGCPSGAN